MIWYLTSSMSILHVSGMFAALAVLTVLFVSAVQNPTQRGVERWLFLSALLVWQLGTIATPIWVTLSYRGRMALPSLTPGASQFVLMACGAACLTVAYVLLVVASFHCATPGWGRRQNWMIHLSPLVWLGGAAIERLGPRMIPVDLVELLGFDLGTMAWASLKMSAVLGMGWGCLLFWTIWYIALFGQPRLAAMSEALHQKPGAVPSQLAGG
jgi:hypothetical protein